MKTCLILLSLVLFSSVSHSQDLKKQIEELDTAIARNNYPDAKKWIEKINPQVAAIKDDSLVIDFLSSGGSVYYHLNDYATAQQFFLQAAEKSKLFYGEADYHYNLALFNAASCYKEEGRYAEAEPLYLKSLPVLATVFGQSSVEYTSCFYTLALLYIDMGRYNDAEGMCAAAVNFYKTILGPTSDDYLGALGAMGIVYQGLARYDKAEEIFLSLKNYYKGLAYPPAATLQTLENNLGELYRHMGDYKRAEPALLNAVAMAGETTAAAYSLNNLALVQKAIGKYAEAEESYRKSLAIYRSIGKTDHPDYTNPLNNLGELYRTMGRWQEAVYAFEEAIDLRKRLLGTDHPNYANAVNNLALVEFSIGMYPEAEKHLLECKEIYKKTLGEKDKYYANCINNLAGVYKVQGKLRKAEEYYKECIRIYKETYGETNDKYGVYLGGLGGTYRQMKRYDEAIAITLQSLAILKNKLGENHYDCIETEYNLAETYREAGKPVEAEKHYLQSMKGYLLLIEKYFPFLSERDKTAFYYTVSNAFETFNSFVMQQSMLQPAKKQEALVARMYNNQVALKSLLLKESEKIRSGIASDGSAELTSDYEEWMKLRQSIVQHYRLSPEDLESKGISLPALEQKINNLEQKINIALKLSRPDEIRSTVSWNDIQSKLKQGEYAVEIVRTDYFEKGRWTDTVYYAALIVDKFAAVPKLVMLTNGNLLEGKGINNYRRALRSKIDDNSSYASFWEPLKKAMPGATRVYVSADGVYQQINLYTLKNPATGKYLIDETDISLVTNTRDLLLIPGSSSSKKAEIFSFPDYGSNKTEPVAGSRFGLPGFPELKELPGTKIESDSVKKIMIAQRWTVADHLQKQATEEAIKKIKSPQVLHIATHGFFLKDIKDSTEKVFGMQSEIARQNPLLRSGVILANAVSIANDSVVSVSQEDGILTAYEAVGLELSTTDLVVLSACETGLGDMLNGQGVYGLQRSFLVAGAKSVIMSLWMIDDFATQELMVNFYREWLKDPSPENKQKAFKLAQMKLKEKYPNPYYWGAFVIVGN